MTQEQLIRTYIEADLPQVFDDDQRVLAKQGWQVASQRDSGPPQRTLTVIYARDLPAPASKTYAAEPSPAQAAMIPTPVISPPARAPVHPLRELAPVEHNYRFSEIAPLFLGTVGAVVLGAFGGPMGVLFSPIGFVLGVVTGLFAYRIDRFGMRTMRGLLRPSRMDRERPAPGIFVLWVLGYPVLLPIYTVLTIGQYLSRRKLVNPLRTAQIEAQMGIMPMVFGTCRSCGRDLHLGAEYCAYCGTTVIDHPKVCAKCGSTALPDALFCPQCRAALT